MDRLSKVLIVVIIFQAVALAGLGYLYLTDSGSEEEGSTTAPEVTEEQKEQEEQVPEVALVEKEDVSRDVYAALVWWDQDSGFESMKNYGGYLTGVTPFWYELNEDGEIAPFSGAEDEEVLAFLRENGIEILPILSNEFERLPLANIIADSVTMNKHVDEIVGLVDDNDYDGISLNYENLNQEDRGRFTDFVKALSDKLHVNNKKIFVHVHAKTEEPGTWNGPQSQDWSALGQASDGLKIMSYDYHWSTSDPGPISPITWFEDVLDYALTVVPKEKVYMGIGLYGYDWGSAEEAESLTYEDMLSLTDRSDVTPSFDSESKSPYFKYTELESMDHEVWFENSRSVGEKLKLVEAKDVAGVSLFRLGGEDKGIYDEFAEEF